MRVVQASLIILCILISNFALAQDEDPPYVYQPTRILFNTRGDSPFGALHSQLVDINNSSGYKDFADMARLDGHVVSQQHIANITSGLLNNYDVLVLPLPYAPTAAETQALKAWISDGGGLLLMVDHSAKYQHLDAWEVFLKEYGIGFGSDNLSTTNMTIDKTSVMTKWWPNKMVKAPIKDGVSAPNQWVSTYLTVDKKKARTIVKDNKNNKIFSAVSTTHNLGKGRVLVIGDWLLFNSDSWLAGVPIDQADNFNFSRNVFIYLSGAADLTAEYIEPVKSKYKVGKRLKCKIKMVNEGTQSSFATYVNVYLSKKRILYNKKNVKYLLGKYNLNAIHPNMSRIENFKAKVPADVNPGKYFVIVDFDPERDFDDLYYDNNVVRSKSRLEIIE